MTRPKANAKKKKKSKTRSKPKVDPKNPYGLKKDVRMKSLDPFHQTRTRKELLDADYLKKLKPEDLKWYAQFIDESVGGAVHKNKNGKVKKGYLHNTKELAKQCYDANNHRNNDVFTVNKANYLLQDLNAKLDESDGWYVHNTELTEDATIQQMEDKEAEDSILTLEEYKKALKDGAKFSEEINEFYKKYYGL